MDIEISADDKPSFEGVISSNNTEARIVGIDVPFMDLVFFFWRTMRRTS